MPPEAGTTLIELMVSMGLIVVVLGSAITAFLASGQVHRDLGENRHTGESARLALDVIERYVERTGFGIHPEFAVDFEWQGTCTAGTPCRDAFDSDSGAAADSDELVVLSRSIDYFAAVAPDPAGVVPTTAGNAWVIASADNAQILLEGNAQGRTILKNQIILAICPGGFTYAYVTTSARKDIPDGANTNVPVLAESGNNPYRRSGALDQGCFDTGLARAFLVDRYRFFVRNDSVTGEPGLWLDQAVDRDGDGDPLNDAVPVAPNVEDIQVTYLTRGGGKHGDSGTAIGVVQPKTGTVTGAGANDLGAKPCSRELTVAFYSDRALVPCPVRTAQRTAPHAGNIVAIRITVVARTPTPKRGSEKDVQEAPGGFSVENRDRTGEAVDGYRRARATSIIPLPNMHSRGVPLI